MKKVERDMIAKHIVQFYESRGRGNKNFTWKHFQQQGFSKSTVYGILQRSDEKGTSTTKSPPGRPPKVKTPQLLKKINAEFAKDPNVSCRTIASKLHVSLGYLSDIKVH